jgi:hypothetical protein
MTRFFQFLSQLAGGNDSPPSGSPSPGASTEPRDDESSSRLGDRLMKASVVGPFMALALLGDVVLMELARRRVQPEDISMQKIERPKVKESVPAEQVAEALRVQYVGDGRVVVADADTLAISDLRTRLQRESGRKVRLELSAAQEDYISLINVIDDADVLIPLEADGAGR